MTDLFSYCDEALLSNDQYQYSYCFAGALQSTIDLAFAATSGGPYFSDIGVASGMGGVITHSSNAFLPEYADAGLALWVWAAGGGTAPVTRYAYLRDSGAGYATVSAQVPVTWTPETGHGHTPMPATVVTATLNSGVYVDLHWAAVTSPDSRLPIVWYQVYEGTTDITDRTVPNGPRALSKLMLGPYTPGQTLTYRVDTMEPVFRQTTQSALVSITIPTAPPPPPPPTPTAGVDTGPHRHGIVRG